ncbi:MAG: cytochrome c, class [Bryobacterales bacterium]|nr:cytochrome c, class [Bryobacterales bacterium]
MALPFYIYAQLPSTPGTKATVEASPAAIAGSKENPEAVARGSALFKDKCGSCHGMTAKGTNKAPDLVRSLLVLDDEKGLLIAPVIRNGHKNMPSFGLTEPQIADIVAWMHAQTYAADHRNTYLFLDALTGDPKKGEAYFNGAGGCNKCHSAAGDLKGIGAKFDAHTLQGRWLQPRSGRGATSKSPVTALITLPDGKKVEGVLERYDDFTVSVRDAAGEYHSYNRNNGVPKVEVKDPVRIHTDMLRKYTDSDIHNVTAYLASLK